MTDIPGVFIVRPLRFLSVVIGSNPISAIVLVFDLSGTGLDGKSLGLGPRNSEFDPPVPDL